MNEKIKKEKAEKKILCPCSIFILLHSACAHLSQAAFVPPFPAMLLRLRNQPKRSDEGSFTTVG